MTEPIEGLPPRGGFRILCAPFGGGVIGNTPGSGPDIGGSSPPPRASGVAPPRPRRLVA